jgi:hypothetical protein
MTEGQDERETKTPNENCDLQQNMEIPDEE